MALFEEVAPLLTFFISKAHDIAPIYELSRVRAEKRKRHMGNYYLNQNSESGALLNLSCLILVSAVGRRRRCHGRGYSHEP